MFAHGLIPAHAGKTGVPAHSERGDGAHPRSRGENQNEPGSNETMAGSSPLTRGKHALAVARLDSAGLIPAHAGKTPPRFSSWSPAPAHPRSRGENVMFPPNG